MAEGFIGNTNILQEVISEPGLPVKSFNEVRSALVSALASHGQMSDVLKIYEDMKEDQCKLEPKAIVCLIACSTGGEYGLLLRMQDWNDITRVSFSRSDCIFVDLSYMYYAKDLAEGFIGNTNILQEVEFDVCLK